VHKEPGETHEADLTIFSCKSRVFCSPSMAIECKFSPSKQLVGSKGLRPWIKMQLFCILSVIRWWQEKVPRKKLVRDFWFGWVAQVKDRTESIPIRTYRTNNRNRSLSFINSDQVVNVNKGSRQIKPVTLGKRLALMIGQAREASQFEYCRLDSSRHCCQRWCRVMGLVGGKTALVPLGWGRTSHF